MTQTLLAAAELWRPAKTGGHLDCVAGFYGDLEALRNVAAQIAPATEPKAIDEVFQTGQPRVITEFSEMGFLTEEAVKAGGLGGAVLAPSFEQGKVTSVLVMYFRGGAEAVGGVELWAGTKGRFELSLDQSYYTGLDRFARISQYVNFPQGAGLPGKCWETALPHIVPDVTTAKGFLRSSGAESDGLSVGLGLPIMRRTELRAVLLMLSSSVSPIARVHEVWVEDPETPGTLVRSQGVYGGLNEFAAASQNLSFSIASGAGGGEQGLPGRAWASGQPLLLEGIEAMAEAGMSRQEAGRAAGLSQALVMPVVVVDRVRAVVLLMG